MLPHQIVKDSDIIQRPYGLIPTQIWSYLNELLM